MASNLLEIGKSGVFSARKALNTTAHNIANVNTPGYSRQNAHIETNMPIGDGNIVVGQGSSVKSVKRMHSEFIQSKLQDGLSQNQYFEDRYRFLEGLENIFNEISQGGLHLTVNDFFNNFKDLANRPENDTVRSLVREGAKNVIKEIQNANQSLNDNIKHIDRVTQEAIKDVNSLLETIAKQNIQIKVLESMHGETGDLRDRRDMAIDELAKYMALTTYKDENDNVTINAKGIGTLVSGGKSSELSMGSASYLGMESQEIFLNGQQVSHKFQGGGLKAMHEIKAYDIKSLKDKIDDIAFHLVQSVNAIHRRGFAHNSSPDLSGPKTNINFFKEPLEKFRASEYLDLSDDVKNDINNIVSALNPNSPGDNRVALAISKLKEVPMMGNEATGGLRTLEEDFLQTIGALSLQTSKTKINLEQSEGVLAQTKNIKERISGVSLDEETAKMVQLQHAYDACAKVLRVADEMLNSILEIKR